MSMKHINAVGIEHDLMDILGYGIHNKREAIEAGICADFYDTMADTSDLKKSLIKAAEIKLRGKSYKDEFIDNINSIKGDLPFEDAAELWEAILLLLKNIR